MGCSGDEPDEPTPGDTPAGARTVDTKAKVSEITGALPKKERQRVVKGVTEAVDRWWDAAYLSDGDNPFPGFTPGAAKLARGDADIMTGAKLFGGEDVAATRRRVALDVLAVKKRAVGVTAGVLLVLEAGDDKRYVVRGTVELERDKAEWRIFGYRISAGAEQATPGEGRKQKERPAKEGKS